MAFIFGYRPEDGARWRQEKLDAEEQAALAASAPPARSSDAKPPRPRRLKHSSSAPEIPTDRVLSARSHTKSMVDHAQQKLEIYPVSIEHHRKLYYPRVRLGILRPLGDLPPGVEAPPVPQNPLAPPPDKPKRWGALITDYGKAGDAVEKQWMMRRIQGTLNEPMLGKDKTRLSGGRPGRLSRSIHSPQASACMTSGTTMCLRAVTEIPPENQREDKRQIGLYEDSFQMWQGHYAPPKHGLSTTDATRFADEMVAQKALGRK